MKSAKIYACYSCGHLWSTLNLDKYKAVLEKAGWKGGAQVAPPPSKPYFSWLASAAIAALILYIFFLKLST